MNKKKVWTFEECQEIALKYKTRQEFSTNDRAALNAARRYGWYLVITEHMPPLRKKHDTWTRESVLKCARKHKTLETFRQEYGCITACFRLGIYKEATAHMMRQRRHSYTDEDIELAISKCVYLKDFYVQYPGEYRAMRQRKLNHLAENLKKIAGW